MVIKIHALTRWAVETIIADNLNFFHVDSLESLPVVSWFEFERKINPLQFFTRSQRWRYSLEVANQDESDNAIDVVDLLDTINIDPEHSGFLLPLCNFLGGQKHCNERFQNLASQAFAMLGYEVDDSFHGSWWRVCTIMNHLQSVTDSDWIHPDHCCGAEIYQLDLFEEMRDEQRAADFLFGQHYGEEVTLETYALSADDQNWIEKQFGFDTQLRRLEILTGRAQ